MRRTLRLLLDQRSVGRGHHGPEKLGIPRLINHSILGLVPDVEAAPAWLASLRNRSVHLPTGVLLRLSSSALSCPHRAADDRAHCFLVRANKHAAEAPSGIAGRMIIAFSACLRSPR